MALKNWLSEQRPELANEIFLDIDPGTGLQVGARWKGQLFESNSRCEAVICLLSRSWDASHECKTEYRTAEGLGKQILVARLEELGDSDITSEWQRSDLFAGGAQTEIPVPGGPPVRFSTAALYALRKAIEGTGVGPDNFVWPPQDDPRRAPYRGWEPFEYIDAGVFFGRDEAIVRGMDELRAMRLSGLKPLFVVLGPSGSGKSSFLRAGLIPRLQREDRRFVVLGTMRPERNALTGESGLAVAIDGARQALQLGGSPLGDIKNACLHDPGRVASLLAEIREAAGKRLADAGQDGSAPTLVLPLDQAEELFSADAGEQAEQFLSLLADLLPKVNIAEAGLIVAATIRTDRYEIMQKHPALERIGTVLFNDLKPMPPTQFEKVINGPAARASEGGSGLTLAPDLVGRLIADAEQGADTLPLLALTLARLYADYGSAGAITLTNYESMGGMRDVVNNEIEQILPRDPQQRQTALELLRTAFVPWLASIHADSDQPMRRVARESDLPEASRPLIDALVAKRLLVRDERSGHVVVEVALESLLRQWDELAGWLREDRQNLKTADDIERNTTAWATHDRDPAWLLTGTRLVDAETLAAAPGFDQRLAVAHPYLAAAREAEDERLQAEEQHRQAELQAARDRQQAAEALAAKEKAHAGALRKRSRVLMVVLAVAVVAALVAAVGFVQATSARHQAQLRFRQATALRLVSESQGMLDGFLPGGDGRALDQVLAADKLGPGQAQVDSAMFSAVINRSDTHKIVDTTSPVMSAAVSPDGHRMVSGEDNSTIRIWDADTGQPTGEPLTGSKGWVMSVTFGPDGHRLVSSSRDDENLVIWNVDTGQRAGQINTNQYQHAGGVETAAFSPDGHRLATNGPINEIQILNVDTGQPIGPLLVGHTVAVDSLAFSPDGHRLVSGSGDSTIRIWDADTGQPIGAPLIGHTGGVNSVAISPDGHRIVSGGGDGTVRIWNADTGQPIGAPLIGHTAGVNSVAISPDGHRIVSGGDDKTLRLWNADAGQPIGAPLIGHTDRVSSVAFTPNGKRMVSGSVDHTMRVWYADTAVSLIGHTDDVLSVAFSPDGKRLASASADDTVRIWNADTGQPIGAPLTAHTAGLFSAVFSPDGKRLAAGGGDGTVRIWDVDTGQQLAQLRGDSDPVLSVAFSSDGHRIVSGSNRTVRIWNADTGQQIGASLSGRSPVAFSSDGHRIASNNQLWNADTGQAIGAPLAPAAPNTPSMNDVAFSPDGHRLASAGSDNTVRLWNADTGQPIGAPLTGHTKAVNGVAFSPDGQYLASGSDDKTLRLWNVNTGQPIGTPLTGHTDAVTSVAFSPDARRIASGGNDNTLRIWAGPAAWPDTLCAKLTANMGHKQWRDWVSPNIDYTATCPGLAVPSD